MEQLYFDLKDLAEAEYDRAEQRYLSKKELRIKELTEKLHDLDFCVALGLPAFLPKETIDILSQTMTLSELGPSVPMKANYYKKYGIADNNSMYSGQPRMVN